MTGFEPRIAVLGGHEFRPRPAELAIVEHLLALTGADSPRVCLLPTASGDPREGIAGFYATMARFACRASHLSLFRLEHERVDLRRHLAEQDLVYVAGGSMLNLLAIWRVHAVGAVLEAAWRSGTLIAGQSAGAMCWFEHGITASAGEPRPAAGLGLLPGSLCVHYGRDPNRRAAYLRAVSAGLPGGFALDDGAGLLFEGSRPVEAFAGGRGARVVRVEVNGAGPREAEIHPLPLAPRLEAPDPAVAEMRQIRRLRRTRRAG